MKKRIIEYLIKKFLVGYHLRKNPHRRQVEPEVTSATGMLIEGSDEYASKE